MCSQAAQVWRRWRGAFALAAAVALVPVCGVAHSDKPAETPFDETQALRYSQDAIGRRVGDYRFIATSGRAVRLSDFEGKPLVVSFIYTSCVHICPTVTQTMGDAVPVAREALGEESFAVITIGFDTKNDTPPRMLSFRRAQGIDQPAWSFLSADPSTIKAFVRDLGFLYRSTPHGFDHLVQTTVLDADGVVIRQIYGDSFAPPKLVEPLKDLIFGRNISLSTVEGLINRVRLFCTIYDPNSERYRFDYSIFIMLGIGSVVLSGLGIFLGRNILRLRRQAHGH